MKTMQPVRVTYTNGTTTNHEVDMFNLYTLLSTLDFDKVAGIQYGEAIVNKGPAEFRPSGVDYTYDKADGMYRMTIYDTNDQRVAVGKYEPTKLQQAAVNLLQQTTYRFIDVQDDHDHMAHRLEGLDK